VDEEDDEYATFGNFVARAIRSLHSGDRKRDLKQTIEKAIKDVTELEDSVEEACLSTTSDIVPSVGRV
jgi:flagellar motor component MotA